MKFKCNGFKSYESHVPSSDDSLPSRLIHLINTFSMERKTKNDERNESYIDGTKPISFDTSFEQKMTWILRTGSKKR